jgi:hypothetical protein
MRTRTTLLTLLFAVTFASPARAEITGYVLESISAVGSFDLDDRIGPRRGDDEHVINIDDCLAYQGQEIEVSFSVTTPDPSVGDEFVAKQSQPSGSCPTSDLDDVGDSETCVGIIHEAEQPDATGNTFTVDMDELIGVDCSAGTEETTKVYIVYEDVADVIESETISFLVDLDAPTAPTDVEAFPGESSIQVTWTDDANGGDDGVTYRVYYRAGVPVESVDKADGSSSSAEDASSETITGLDANETYYFRVAAIDENDNEGELSKEEASTTTVPATDFWERYKDEGGGDPGGFCFIATAAYGTPMASEVDTLRRFRDRFLMTSSLGRSFVSFYYQHSPPLARAIRKNVWLAAAARVLLAPLLLLAWFLVELGLLGKLAVLLVGWAAVRTFRVLTRRRYARGGTPLRRLPLLMVGEEGETC